ncbi:MAG: tripartite tricarboxylate transporter permease [Nanohaloarchaea archaeon]|nr:tripartite tricarboxylate transporter permease [Candidatus Nanohaloarchaea archaeon]
MWIELGLAVLGVFAGVFTGLTPGIHPNTVIFTSLPFYLGSSIEFMYYLSFIAGLSVSHTFHDFLPSIFLGVPEAETALASVAGADMANEGKGIEAFHYTVLGGSISVIVMIMLSPLLILFLPYFYKLVNPVMFYVLVFFQLVLVFNSEGILKAGITAILSGILGLIAFSMPVNSQNVLMPVFAGLFAVPTFLSSFKPVLEEQETPNMEGGFLKGSFFGTLAGLITGIVPGVTGVVSTSFFTPFMEKRTESFLAAMGAVNTSDILISFLGLYLIEKARSGAAVAMSSAAKFNDLQLFFLIGVSLTAIGLSIPVALKTPPYFLKLLEWANLRIVLIVVLGLLLSSTFFLTGFLGLLILLVSSCIGYSAALSSQRKVLVSVLLVPSITYFAANGFFI